MSSDTIALLRGVPVFAGLPDTDLARIGEVAVPRTFERAQVVFREGDRSDTCYVIRSGRARAVREHAGRAIAFASFGRGDIFGELAMFGSERRSATVEALERTQALALLGPDMRRLLRRHPDIAVQLLGSLAERLRETSERLAQRSFQTAQSRVATVLIELLATGHGERPAHSAVIRAKQSEIAQLAGCSRESASRFLATLERAEIVTQGRGKLVVHDPDALARYVY